MGKKVNTITFKNGSRVDILEQAGLKASSAMGRTVDKELYFPMFDYEKKHLSKWERFTLWREEMQQRIQIAIEVLKGQHYCEE